MKEEKMERRSDDRPFGTLDVVQIGKRRFAVRSVLEYSAQHPVSCPGPIMGRIVFSTVMPIDEAEELSIPERADVRVISEGNFDYSYTGATGLMTPSGADKVRSRDGENVSVTFRLIFEALGFTDHNYRPKP